MATLYTRDHDNMRRVDVLVIDYPDTTKSIGETDINNNYDITESVTTYRSRERISEEQRKAKQNHMKSMNNAKEFLLLFDKTNILFWYDMEEHNGINDILSGCKKMEYYPKTC